MIGIQRVVGRSGLVGMRVVWPRVAMRQLGCPDAFLIGANGEGHGHSIAYGGSVRGGIDRRSAHWYRGALRTTETWDYVLEVCGGSMFWKQAFWKTMCWKGGRAARGQVSTYVVPRACIQLVCAVPSGLCQLG